MRRREFLKTTSLPMASALTIDWSTVANAGVPCHGFSAENESGLRFVGAAFGLEEKYRDVLPNYYKKWLLLGAPPFGARLRLFAGDGIRASGRHGDVFIAIADPRDTVAWPAASVATREANNAGALAILLAAIPHDANHVIRDGIWREDQRGVCVLQTEGADPYMELVLAARALYAAMEPFTMPAVDPRELRSIFSDRRGVLVHACRQTTSPIANFIDDSLLGIADRFQLQTSRLMGIGYFIEDHSLGSWDMFHDATTPRRASLHPECTKICMSGNMGDDPRNLWTNSVMFATF